MMVLYKIFDYGGDPKSKMAATVEHSLTLEQMMVGSFFSETIRLK